MSPLLQLLEEHLIENVYKFICAVSATLELPKHELMELWCREQRKPLSVFDELKDLSLATCFNCGGEQLVLDAWNYHCQKCPHYFGPAQCTNPCCIW